MSSIKAHFKIKMPNISYHTNVDKQVKGICEQGLQKIKKKKKGLYGKYLNSMYLQRLTSERRNVQVYAISNSMKSMAWFQEKGHIIKNSSNGTFVKGVPHIKPTRNFIRREIRKMNVELMKGDK